MRINEVSPFSGLRVVDMNGLEADLRLFDLIAELEHIHMGFVKASRQYAVMTQPQQAANGYAQAGQDRMSHCQAG
jgi:hypothetical protein